MSKQLLNSMKRIPIVINNKAVGSAKVEDNCSEVTINLINKMAKEAYNMKSTNKGETKLSVAMPELKDIARENNLNLKKAVDFQKAVKIYKSDD